MTTIPLEENARLYAVARSILLGNEEEYRPSSNPDFEKRRQLISKNHDKKIEEILQKISLDDWEEIKTDETIDSARSAFGDVLLYDDDNNLLYFEMGMRCGYVLFSDLTDTVGTISEPTPEQNETEPPKIEDIMTKDPATLTHEEITIIYGATDYPEVLEYYLRIPDKRRNEYKFIERMNKYYDVIYINGKIAEFKEKPTKLSDFSHLSPEEIRRIKIKRNYLDFHRMHVQEWCRNNEVKYTASND